MQDLIIGTIASERKLRLRKDLLGRLCRSQRHS